MKARKTPSGDQTAHPHGPRRAARSALCAAVALLAAGLACSAALAALYKWTDANGRVIYSDQPPPGNVKVETINAPPPPANPGAMKDLVAKDAELKKAKQARADDEAKATKARVDANQLREQCERARGQMIILAKSNQVVLYGTNAQGERVVMTDDARLREHERLEVWIRDNCRT